MDRLRNFNVESLQKELKPSALKSRAAQLNDRFSSPSSSSSSNSYSATRPVQSTSGRPLPPARPSSKPSTQLTAPPGRPSSSDSVISTAPPPPPRNVGATRGRNEPTIAAGREQAHTWQPRVQGDDDGASGAASATRIDWRNLSRQDHDALFGILDNVRRTRTLYSTYVAWRRSLRVDVVSCFLSPRSSQATATHRERHSRSTPGLTSLHRPSRHRRGRQSPSIPATAKMLRGRTMPLLHRRPCHLRGHDLLHDQQRARHRL